MERLAGKNVVLNRELVQPELSSDDEVSTGIEVPDRSRHEHFRLHAIYDLGQFQL